MRTFVASMILMVTLLSCASGPQQTAQTLRDTCQDNVKPNNLYCFCYDAATIDARCRNACERARSMIDHEMPYRIDNPMCESFGVMPTVAETAIGVGRHPGMSTKDAIRRIDELHEESEHPSNVPQTTNPNSK